MARCLIIGCGCRGRMLARELVEAGHPTRATTRNPARLSAIEATGAEAVVADPNRVATVVEALHQVTVVMILLGSAQGSPLELEALHGPRLEMLLTKLVDTTVRGLVYENRGSVPSQLLALGAEQVRAFGRDTRARYELLETSPGDAEAWVAAARAAVERTLAAA